MCGGPPVLKILSDMGKLTDNKVVGPALLSLSIVALGLFVKGGMDNFTEKDRRVSVKGLSEREVEADKVTWPILSKEVGNSLPELYGRINATEAKIKKFLKDNGIKENEIMVNAPVVKDLNANEYSDNNRAYRYIITSAITVTSRDVKLVRSILARQGELLREGIAIVDGGYEAPVKYEFVSFTQMKPEMMQEAIANAEKTAEQFAANSKSRLSKIISADQGQFSIEDRDGYTPYIKKVRVVSTVVYSLKD